jgi:hypothetical protein
VYMCVLELVQHDDNISTEGFKISLNFLNMAVVILF